MWVIKSLVFICEALLLHRTQKPTKHQTDLKLASRCKFLLSALVGTSIDGLNLNYGTKTYSKGRNMYCINIYININMYIHKVLPKVT